MIRNGLLGEAQADGTMKMCLCFFHEYDFGLGVGRFVFLPKIRRQKWTRFESCMKASKPAQAPGITERTVLASDEQKPNFVQKSVTVSPVLSVIAVPQSAERWHSPQLKASSGRWLQVCTCSNPSWMANTISIPAQGPPAFSGHIIHFQASWN